MKSSSKNYLAKMSALYLLAALALAGCSHNDLASPTVGAGGKPADIQSSMPAAAQQATLQAQTAAGSAAAQAAEHRAALRQQPRQ